MKIGLVLRHFDAQRGGAERWTWQLAEQAAAAGYEIHVVAEKFSPASRALAIVPHVVPRVHSPYAFAAAIDEKLRELDLDLVHDMGFGWHFDILQPHMGSWRAQFERKLLALPPWMRVARRALATASPRSHQRDRLCWRQYADQRRIVVGLSKLVARDLERMHGWPMERTRLVYNGVDLARFNPKNRAVHRDAVRRRLQLREEELVVLFVAHNFALKGLPTLIRAIGQLRQANRPVRLLAIGGDRPGAYARLARRYGAGDAVRFLGPIEDTVPFYAAADVFALPTWYDSCSLVLLEAVASGLPVITTANNGASELLTEGLEGFVLDDPGDWEELTRGLKMLLDSGTRARLGSAARRLAERHPLEANYRQVMGLWQQVAGRMRRAA
jgi:UDP-glucose:(heptosyl)LPS alpha-1,3-glucosyltransferase